MSKRRFRQLTIQYFEQRDNHCVFENIFPILCGSPNFSNLLNHAIFLFMIGYHLISLFYEDDFLKYFDILLPWELTH